MTDKFIPSTQFIEKLPNICVDLELVSVYDMDCYSVPQLLYRLAQKINDTITNMEHNDEALKAHLEDLQAKLEYLLGEGLTTELQKIFEKMYADGSLQALVEASMVDIKRRLTTLEEKAENNKHFYNIKDFGAKEGDKTFDNGPKIQEAINEAYNNKGGIVYIPNGKWYVSTGIELKAGVTLLGESVVKPDDNKVGASLVAINCPVLIKALKEEDSIDLYYRWSVGIKNLILINDETNVNGIGLHLKQCAYTRLEDVHISYFRKGIVSEAGMLDSFTNCAVFACTEAGIHYTLTDAFIGTSQIHNNVYIGQMVSGVGLKIDKGSLTDITLNRPTFESSPQAIDSNDDNCIFTINDLYMENVPRNGAGTAIKVGNESAWKSTFAIKGGFIQGHNTNAWNNATLFKFEYLNICSIENLTWNRYGKVIDETTLDTNKSKPIFRSCVSEEGLVTPTGDLDAIIYKDKIIIDSCNVKSKGLGYTKIIPTVYGNKWSDFDGGYGGIVIKVNEKDRIVNINGSAKLEAGALNTDNKIITIPTEYKCPSQMFFSGACSKNGEWMPTIFRIVSTGQIEFFDAVGGIGGIGFSLSYNY